MKAQNGLKYYTLEKIKQCNAHYNIIFGQRSNGKTFSVQEEGIRKYIESGEQMAIIRRYDLDIQGKRGSETFKHFIENPERGNIISEMSNGKWTSIYFYSARWYLCKYDEKGNIIKDVNPFCYAFSLSGMEHDKSTSYPKITTVLFDEFMTRDCYMTDEFVIFTNVLSTIIRQRNNVKVYMCGNTVNRYCPYFKEMGLDNIQKMLPGDIQVYEFASMGKDILRIAVEYADNPNKNGKPSDVYFAFNNPKLKMITNGMWELAIYPHLPMKYTNKDKFFEYFIIWENETLHCECINVNDVIFTYIHRKTTPIKDQYFDLVFSTNFNARYNWRRRITKPTDELGKKILWFFKNDKVFYQDNEVGEVVRNYMNWCVSGKDFT